MFQAMIDPSAFGRIVLELVLVVVIALSVSRMLANSAIEDYSMIRTLFASREKKRKEHAKQRRRLAAIRRAADLIVARLYPQVHEQCAQRVWNVPGSTVEITAGVGRPDGVWYAFVGITVTTGNSAAPPDPVTFEREVHTIVAGLLKVHVEHEWDSMSHTLRLLEGRLRQAVREMVARGRPVIDPESSRPRLRIEQPQE